MHNQRLPETSDRPNIRTRRCVYAEEITARRGDHFPLRPVPMLYQSARVGIADGPYVIRGHGSHRVEETPVWVGVDGAHLGPRLTVPVLGQRPVCRSIPVRPDSPHIIWREGTHIVQISL